MLGKLIKHEWRSTYKVGLLMVVLTLAVTFLGWLSFQSPMWQSLSDESNMHYSFNPLDLLSIVVLLMYVFMLVGITYGMLIYLGVHFYKTMYSAQGYLTHTLPAGKHQLLISKLLVSSLWLLIVYLLVFLSAMAVMGSLIGAIIPDGVDWGEIWSEIYSGMDMFSSIFDLDLGGYLLTMLVSAILGPFITITTLFGSITVGQLFTKVRVLMAIVCYVGVLMVSGIVSSLVQSMISAGVGELGIYMNISTVATMLTELTIAVLLYIASYQIITRRLNME